MSDALHQNVRAAIRTSLLTIVKGALAGITTISALKIDAETVEFDWTAGLFTQMGFAAGDEFAVAGFAAASLNGRWFIHQVSDTAMQARLPQEDITSGLRIPATEAAGAAISMVAGWPTGQADENVVFEPNTGEPFIRENYKAGPEQRRSLVTYVSPSQPRSASVRLTFLYMLNVCYPSGLGMRGVDGLVDALRATVYPGKILTYNGQSLTILQVTRQGSQSGDWVSVPVSIRGFTDTFTP